MPHGRFIWHDLLTSDPDAAEAFYREVMLWDAREAEAGGPPYRLFLADGAPSAGLMRLPEALRAEGVPPAWSGYVEVDDVDDAAARVTQAGGTLRRGPEDLAGVGRFAAVADPHGAVFLLFRPDTPVGLPPPGTPGHAGWHELHSGDPDSTFAFYAGLFGWTKGDAIPMGAMGSYQLFAVDGVPMGGMMRRTAFDPGPYWLHYFTVDGVQAAGRRVRAAGGTIINGPIQVPGGGWVLYGRDPQGAVFALTGARL